MENKAVKRSINIKLVSITYIISAITYLVGFYLIKNGYWAGYLAAIPTLILGVYLFYRNEKRFGIILLIFFFVWLVTYYY